MPAEEPHRSKQIMEGLPGAFNADAAAGVEVIFGFDITGGGGGAWSVTVKDGACELAEGAHSSPTTTLTMGADDFIAMMTGQMSAMSAFTSGKLKIGGDVMKSQLIEKLFTL